MDWKQDTIRMKVVCLQPSVVEKFVGFVCTQPRPSQDVVAVIVAIRTLAYVGLVGQVTRR